jgi:hypothetical protein
LLYDEPRLTENGFLLTTYRKLCALPLQYEVEHKREHCTSYTNGSAAT